jgi:glycosyltransferase involved in cell wall biosynthesis
LETFDPDVLQTIQQSTASFAPEAVVVLELGMDMYRDGLPSGTPILIDQVEVSGSARAYHEATGVLPRLRAQLTYEKSRKYWSDRLSCYHAVTAVSQEEATAVRQVIGSGNPPVLVVPNGVNLAGYDNRDRDRMVPGRLLYNGAMTYTLNREAVLWFVREILPTVAQAVPEAHLVVTGRYNEESVEELLVNPRVHLTGFLPELTEILAQSAVCVVPLLAGGGTRLKILEAWAAGLPVVSTSIGAKGLEAKDGIHLLLGDNAETFAQQTIALLRNSSQAEQIADNARRYVTERFDWTAIGAQLSNHIEKMVTQTL